MNKEKFTNFLPLIRGEIVATYLVEYFLVVKFKKSFSQEIRYCVVHKTCIYEHGDSITQALMNYMSGSVEDCF